MYYRLDLFDSVEPGTYSPKFSHNGSIIFESNKDVDWVLYFLHHGGGTMITEGIEISCESLVKYTLIKYISFFGQSSNCLNLIKNSNDFQLIEAENFTLKRQKNLEASSYILLESFSESELEELASIIPLTKSVYIYEWGASDYWVKYFIGLLSGTTLKVVEKLLKSNKRIRSNVFEISEKVREDVSKEYNIDIDSLDLVSYKKDEGKYYITFVSLHNQIDIELEDNEITSLKKSSTNKFLY